MTEAEWLACDDPEAMLAFLWVKPLDRKFRLFACACCRAVWPLLVDERSRAGVEAAESLADGRTGEDELVAASRATSRAAGGAGPRAAESAAATGAGVRVAKGTSKRAVAAGLSGRIQAELLRDIIGNPFRPVTIKQASLSPPVTALARAAYDDRQLPSGRLDPNRLLALADALEEAGCIDPDIVGHLRGPGPHVRGCFAVDLCLGLS